MKAPVYTIMQGLALAVLAYAFGHFMGSSECRAAVHRNTQRMESLADEWDRSAAAADRAAAPDVADALRECAWKLRQP